MIDIDKMNKECWSLDVTIANLILPKLLYFKNFVLPNSFGVPSEFYDAEWDVLYWDEWEEVIDDMVWAFTYASRGYEWYEYEGEIRHVQNEDELTFKIDVDEELWDKYIEKRMKERARFVEGMRLFAKYFSSLWD